MAVPPLPGFKTFDFVANGYKHPVYKKGREGHGPGVLLVQELPGITPETVALAERLHDDGFVVYMPVLFGDVNVPAEPMKNLGRVCISLEFRVLANRRKSPVTDWLRALCRRLQEDTGGPVGAIGMCFTGGFVLALMVDESVAAPVMSQPSHVGGLLGAAANLSLGMPDGVVRDAVERSKRDDVPVLGVRFDKDIMCTQQRFDRLSELFGENFRRIEIDRSLYAKHRIKSAAHSVLTLDYCDQPGHPTRDAYEQVVGFLHERLDRPSSGGE
jgi:dienelactone hydrolase